MQPSLFDVPPTPPSLPYQRGSQTSKAAAVRAVRFAESQRSRILAWLIAQGPRGGTQLEAQVELQLKPQSASPRFRRLEQDKLIRKAADVRDGARVYKAN